MSQLITIILFYFLILFSILGFGRIVTIFNSNYQVSSFDGLIGISILILISFITNLFFPHNLIHNSIVITFGLFLFIFDLKNNFSNRIKEIKLILLVFSIIFIGILLYKNHDDFYYYHFPYSLILTNFEKIFGLGNLNHGFRTPSSIFYLNSLFYLPGIKYFLMNSGAIYIFGFVNLVLIELIVKYLKQNSQNFILFLSVLSFVYINSKFSRFSEHGTDLSAIILIFLMAVYYYENVNSINKISRSEFFKEYFIKINILFILIISLKTFYIIYLLIYLAWLYENKSFFLKKGSFTLIIKNFSTYVFILILFFVFFTIFSNTGCLIYPASFTCFEQFSWSIPIGTVEQMNLWYEQWSKAGAGPNFRVENPEIYILKFNWVPNWFEMYFFTKVSDNIFVIILVSLITYLILSFKNKRKNNYKYKYLLFYILLIILFFEWFYNHPALRYGGYSLIALIIFIPISLLISGYVFNLNILKKRIYFLMFLSTFIFLSKNISRISNEIDKYNYKPVKSSFFYLNKDGFKINDTVSKLYEKNFKYSDNLFFILNKRTMSE
tara:strand:+ start:2012 stop:3667 length:1656 start_codon:yes stop_codon:yes gene_type:complete